MTWMTAAAWWDRAGWCIREAQEAIDAARAAGERERVPSATGADPEFGASARSGNNRGPDPLCEPKNRQTAGPISRDRAGPIGGGVPLQKSMDTLAEAVALGPKIDAALKMGPFFDLGDGPRRDQSGPRAAGPFTGVGTGSLPSEGNETVLRMPRGGAGAPFAGSGPDGAEKSDRPLCGLTDAELDALEGTHQHLVDAGRLRVDQVRDERLVRMGVRRAAAPVSAAQLDAEDAARVRGRPSPREILDGAAPENPNRPAGAGRGGHEYRLEIPIVAGSFEEAWSILGGEIIARWGSGEVGSTMSGVLRSLGAEMKVAFRMKV